MHLNTLSPAEGAKKKAKRVGRGIGCTLGKTCGRGHKGLKARSGGKVPAGFEGGQMPLKQRLPKFGFTSRKSLVSAEIRLGELNKVDGEQVDLAALRAAGLINRNILNVKVILSGSIEKAVSVTQEVRLSKGAKAAVEAAGGKVAEAAVQN